MPGATIGVVGAGVMGAGIAQIAAQAGFSVILCDAAEGAAEKARETIAKQFARMREKGRMTSSDAEEASYESTRRQIWNRWPPRKS